MINKILLILGILFSLIFPLHSEPQISYLIPDIGSPGMGVYVEIIGPANYFYNFGPDTIYFNNDGFVKILFDNPQDTEKVIVGPIGVFWQGRMVSTYFFIDPSITTPNSNNWTQLDYEFKIPFRVSVGGELSNPDTFYIVQPYSFGNLLLNNFVFGTGALGLRSRSGAMIVDEIIFRNGSEYKVFLDNSISYPSQNRSYLPFILLCKGNISGGSNTRINISGGEGRIQNGGPGGGGGGGKFCDFLTGNPGEDGGNGFTSGGYGGVNNLFGGGNYKQYGSGTGDSGKSLNGVLPAVNPGGWEASGGGTGHPFGKSGIGSGDQSNWNVSGGFGGGTGSVNNKMGGSGGFGTDGKSEPSNYLNGGKSHGNEFIVPIAGGSGGASGNPSGFNVCSGSGGGGGGAIRIFAKRIENISILANGANGGSSGNGAGGGGSGGSISICAKELASNLNLSTNGGNGGGNGYFRIDAPLISNVTYSHSNPQVFIGLSTDTTSFAFRKRITLKGSKNPTSDSVLIFLKSQQTSWVLSKVVSGFRNRSDFSFDLDLPDSSKYFYLCAIQDFNFSVVDTFRYKPRYLFSQAAMNIIQRANVGICTGIKTIELEGKGCPGSEITNTGYLLNSGDGPLTFLFSKARFANNTGLELAFPQSDVTLQPGDSIALIVRFVVPNSGFSTQFVDTLLIELPEDGWNPPIWRVIVRVNLLQFNYNVFAPLLNLLVDTVDFGIDCSINLKDTSLVFWNQSPFDIDFKFVYNSEKVIVDTANAHFLSQMSFVPLRIELKKIDVNGLFFDSIVIFPKDCPSLRKVVYLKFFGLQPSTQFRYSNKQIDTLNLGEICIGKEVYEEYFVYNIGNAPIQINNVETFGGLGLSFTFNLNQDIEIFDNLKNSVVCRPNQEGTFTTTLIYNFNQCNYNDTLVIVYKAIKANSVAISGFDFGVVEIGSYDTTVVVIVNTGSGTSYFDSNIPDYPPFKFIKSEPPLPVYLYPNDSLKLYFVFSPITDELSTANYLLIANSNFGCPDTIRFELRGRGSNAKIFANVDSVFFGTFPYCKSRDTIIYVTNKGTTDLLIKKVYIEQSYYPEHFILSNGFSSSRISPNSIDSCAVTFAGVKGAPDGLKTAELVIETNDIQNPVIRIKLSAIQENLKVKIIPDTLDFGICQIGDSKTRTLTLINYGNHFEAQRIKDIEGNKVVFEPSPSVAVLFPGDSVSISFTFRPNREGEFFDSMRVVYYQPCPDTQWVYLRGWGTAGNYKIPSKLEFRNVLICAFDTLNLPIENLGTIPFKVDSVIIFGNDANNFSVLDKFPLIIDSIRYIKVVFSPSYEERSFSAFLRIYLFINNQTVAFDVELVGSRVRPVKFSVNEIDFGEVRNGKFIDTTVSIVNNNSDVFVSEILPFKLPNIFSTNLSFGTPIPSNSLYEFTLTFRPLDDIDYIDTFMVVIKYFECIDTIKLVVKGKGFPPKDVLISLPNLSFDPKKEKAVYPIYAKIYNSKGILQGLTLEATIFFNWKVFHVQGINNGEIISDVIENGLRKITFRVINVELNENYTKLCEFVGVPLLSDTDFTKVDIDKINWTPDFVKINFVELGSIGIIVCREGSKRLVMPNDFLNLSIYNDEKNTVCKIETETYGKHLISVYNILGNLIYQIEFENENYDKIIKQITIPNELLTNGIYFIKVSNLNQTIIKKIVK